MAWIAQSRVTTGDGDPGHTHRVQGATRSAGDTREGVKRSQGEQVWAMDTLLRLNTLGLILLILSLKGRIKDIYLVTLIKNEAGLTGTFHINMRSFVGSPSIMVQSERQSPNTYDD